MITLEKEYEVIDYKNNSWGTVIMKWAHKNCISGALQPTSGFYTAQKIFNHHTEITSGYGIQDEEKLNESCEQLSELKISLIDKSNNIVHKIHGTVFVSEELLLTIDEYK